jgi:mannose-1-phosphate guanylyltransferase
MDIETTYSVVLSTKQGITLDVTECFDFGVNHNHDETVCGIIFREQNKEVNEEIEVHIEKPDLIEALEYLLSKLKANPTP